MNLNNLSDDDKIALAVFHQLAAERELKAFEISDRLINKWRADEQIGAVVRDGQAPLYGRTFSDSDRMALRQMIEMLLGPRIVTRLVQQAGDCYILNDEFARRWMLESEAVELAWLKNRDLAEAA